MVKNASKKTKESEQETKPESDYSSGLSAFDDETDEERKIREEEYAKMMKKAQEDLAIKENTLLLMKKKKPMTVFGKDIKSLV